MRSSRPSSTPSSRSTTTTGRTDPWSTGPHRQPSTRADDTPDRVRTDRVDKAGKVTLRYQGRLYSIGIGRTHTGTRVIVLSQDLDIRIIDAATGELLRELTLDPAQRYQPIPRTDTSH
jgi:hypothetical protein